jgi:hypothetical protein
LFVRLARPDGARSSSITRRPDRPILLRALLDRLAPPRKERPLTVDLPPLKSPQEAPGVIASMLEKVAAGELAHGEATAVAGLLEQYRRQSELADLDRRITALETNHGSR